jgi:hypothetical protein
MADTKISALTAVATPAGTDEFGVNQAGTSKKMTLDQVDGFNKNRVVLDTAYTLTSTTVAQKIFNNSTNGALTLATGWYRFTAVIGITGLSATSGNAQFQILGGGTATLGGVLYHAVGVDGNSGTAATQTGSWAVASNSPASIMTAGTGTALMMDIEGTFEVTATGTIIPSVALVTAAAGSVVVGSFFECVRVGAAGANVSTGSWS